MGLYNNLIANNPNNRVVWGRLSSSSYQFGLLKQINGLSVINQREDNSIWDGKWVHWTLTITEDGVYTLTNDINDKVFAGTNNAAFVNTYLRIIFHQNNYLSNIKIKSL